MTGVPYSTISNVISSKSFAQTISWMPDGGSDGVNVNYVSQAWEYYFGQTILWGIPTIDADWLKLDLWSITTGANDGYDYILSDVNAYSSLRHGFRVHRKGFFKVFCTMTLDDTTNGHHNVAFQVRKKLASASTFTRVGAPVTTGYIKRNSGGSWCGVSILSLSRYFGYR